MINASDGGDTIAIANASAKATTAVTKTLTSWRAVDTETYRRIASWIEMDDSETDARIQDTSLSMQLLLI